MVLLLLLLPIVLSSMAFECVNGHAFVQEWSGHGTKQFAAVRNRKRGDPSVLPVVLRSSEGAPEEILRGGGIDTSGADDNDDDGNDTTTAAISSTTIGKTDYDGEKDASAFGGAEILSEETVYSGWRTIVKRRVRLRNGKIADFDLVGVKTGVGAVLVFAWDTNTKTATIVREYMPASHRILWGLAAGLIEDKHGQDTEVAARHELEEECHLRGGKWYPLLDRPAAMDKYALTEIQCYLVLDPEPEENPKPLDDEEDIEIVSGATIPEILGYVRNGEMNLVGGYGSLLAIEKLRELGEYP